MKLLPNFSSINLHQHCLFCLINYGKSDRFNRSPGQEQVLQLIFSGKYEGVGINFRNLFWKLLMGPVKRNDASNQKITKFLKSDFLSFNNEEDNSINANNSEENAGSFEEGEESDLPNKISVCPYCLDMLVDLRGLFVELEKVQMLFMEQITNIQKIVRGSHHLVQEMMKDITNERPTKIPKESLEKLYEFQENVVSHGKTTISVPFVMLERVPNVERSFISAPSPPAKINQEFFMYQSEEFKSTGKRKRGRPPKNSVSALESQADVELVIADEHPPPPRRRGRPPKSKLIPQLDSILDCQEAETEPQLNQTDSDDEWSPCDVHLDNYNSEDEEYVPTSPKLKRKVGRPPKFSGLFSSPVATKRGVGRPRNVGRPRTKFPTRDSSSITTDHQNTSSSSKSKVELEPNSEEKVEESAEGKVKPVKKNCRLLIRKKEIREEPVERKKVHHRIYRCETCGKIYFKRITFLKHQLAHKEAAVLPKSRYRGNPSMEFDIEENKLCQICKQSFPESDYNSHMLSHEQVLDPLANLPDSKLYSCSHKDCIRKFQVEENLKIHMELDHNELNSRCFIVVKKCDLCNVCYDSSNDLLEHMRKIHKDARKDLIFCPVCSHVFTKVKNMIIHMRSHVTNEQQICFKCPSQKRKTLSKRSELLLHFREEHGFETSGTCNICNEKFEDIYWLKFHLRSIHKAKEVLVCSYCGKTCYHPSAFMKHYTYMHKKAERSGYQCETCNEKFPNPDKLSRHRVLLHGAPKIPCEMCEMEYMTATALKQHMKVHTKEGLRCEICDKYFSGKNNLIQHMAKHSDKRPFTCEICGAGCKTYWQFRSHQQKHTKKHACAECGRRFSRTWALKNHMKMHTGEVTPCQYCGYEFHSEKSLKRHVKTYHTGDPDKLKPLYPPQKRRNLRSHWKDDDGNRVYAYDNENVKSKTTAVKMAPAEEGTSSPITVQVQGQEVIAGAHQPKYESIPFGILGGVSTSLQASSALGLVPAEFSGESSTNNSVILHSQQFL